MSRELITTWEYLSLFAETDRGICRNVLSKLRHKRAINELLFYRGEKVTGNVTLSTFSIRDAIEFFIS